jgi:hypothetical protein
MMSSHRQYSASLLTSNPALANGGYGRAGDLHPRNFNGRFRVQQTPECPYLVASECPFLADRCLTRSAEVDPERSLKFLQNGHSIGGVSGLFV